MFSYFSTLLRAFNKIRNICLLCDTLLLFFKDLLFYDLPVTVAFVLCKQKSEATKHIQHKMQ
jgi:hypothetical protein